MSLIAGKPTFVRVYLDCGEGCTEMQGVTGVLQVIGPVSSVSLNAINQPVTAYHPASWTEHRADLGRTLNFAVPNDVIAAGNVSFTARVGNSSLTVPRPAKNAKTLRVAYVPIHYEPEGRWGWTFSCPLEPAVEKLMTVPAWTRNVMPLAAPVQIETWPTMVWTFPLRNPPDCRKRGTEIPGETERLLRTLQTQWLLVDVDARPDYVFGWLPANSQYGGVAFINERRDGDGRIVIDGVAAAGDAWVDEPLPYSFTEQMFTHEMGHLLGHAGAFPGARVEIR